MADAKPDEWGGQSGYHSIGCSKMKKRPLRLGAGRLRIEPSSSYGP